MKKLLFIAALCVATYTTVNAQGGNDPFGPSPIAPPNNGDVEDVPAPQNTPIDGGLCVLLAAGAGYGLIRIRNNRKL